MKFIIKSFLMIALIFSLSICVTADGNGEKADAPQIQGPHVHTPAEAAREEQKKEQKSSFPMKISKWDSNMLNFFEILPIKLTFSTAVFEARRTFVRLSPRRTTLLA